METQDWKSSACQPTKTTKGLPFSSSSPVHAQPEARGSATADEIEEGKGGWFAYLRTRNFYIALLLGYMFFPRVLATNQEKLC